MIAVIFYVSSVNSACWQEGRGRLISLSDTFLSGEV